MLAPQNQQPTVIDSMSGTKTEWYQAIDEAIRASEIIPGTYEYTTATSYGQVDDVQEGDSTYFDIACDRFKIISLDNSYLLIDQKIPVTVPSQADALYSEYYIGYKLSADFIKQFRIYTNTDELQNINHARYEWFMLYNSMNDAAKEGSDLFATLDKISEKNQFVPGEYYDLSAITAETEILVQLKLRVPLSMFLLLFNLKWHPNWAGKLSVEVYPSYENLVIAPVVPKSDLRQAKWQALLQNSYLYKSTASIDNPANIGFTNINQPTYNLIKSIAATTGESAVPAHYEAHLQTFKASTQTMSGCKIRLATYMLKMDVFNALAAKYIQIPLMFPIQRIQSKDFTQDVGDKVDEVRSATTLSLKHCDSMFVVFKRNLQSRTCFENPGMMFSINLDGKFYPREAYNTLDDLRTINMTFDALNINNSLLYSIPNDLRTSLQPYVYKHVAASNGTLTKKQFWCGRDMSNFFIGIPFCDSEDFMGGISTTGTVQIELTGQRINIPSGKTPTNFGQPVGIYYEDCLLKIRAVKPEGRAQIEITTATIEQIACGIAR